MSGTLYLVATPIGNLEDMSLRALRVLRECDRIACEDTRHSRKLLSHFDIHKPLVSFHAHNWRERTPALLEAVAAGENLALVSDAGMPGIADPGPELAVECRRAGLPVIVIPGASALTMALAYSGTPDSRFAFEGFLPASGRERRARLAVLATELRSVVLFEGPHRLLATLEDLLALGEPARHLTICRELTKLHEQVWEGTLAEALAYFQQQPPRGEFTLVLAGAPPIEPTPLDEAQLSEQLRRLLANGLPRSEASRQLARETGMPRKEIYRLSLQFED